MINCACAEAKFAQNTCLFGAIFLVIPYSLNHQLNIYNTPIVHRVISRGTIQNDYQNMQKQGQSFTHDLPYWISVQPSQIHNSPTTAQCVYSRVYSSEAMVFSVHGIVVWASCVVRVKRKIARYWAWYNLLIWFKFIRFCCYNTIILI